MANEEYSGMCKICGPATIHTEESHRFNYILWEYYNYRKALVKNRHGIKITQQIETNGITNDEQEFQINKGKYVVKVKSNKLENLNKTVKFKFEIFNDRKQDVIYMVLCNFLYPLLNRDHYRVEDPQGIIKSGRFLEIRPKERYQIYVYFEPRKIITGEYANQLAFKFQDAASNQFTFFRSMLVCIQDYQLSTEETGETHYKGEYWGDDVRITPSNPKQYTKDVYPIPDEYFKAIYSGLWVDRDTLPADRETVRILSNLLGRKDRYSGEYISNLSPDNYARFFHVLLWLDEACQSLSLRQYNLSNVTMRIAIENVLELDVEGLAEKRPSLIVGDIVLIRLHGDHTAYECVVKNVHDSSIWIHNFDPILIDMITNDPKLEFDVAFKVGRLVFERKHKAVEMCVSKGLMRTLFPDVELKNRQVIQRFSIHNLSFYNPSIQRNVEQKNAVVSILNELAFPAPYIVFGPPGTGKTVTIVEAILQIKKHKPKTKILICAPSNAACDMLTIKLTEFGWCNKTELIRIHAESRSWSEVPSAVQPFSNHDGIHFTRLEFFELNKYKIVITTLMLIGKFSGHYNPDYVFIDEAAQAQEPEADIAISMVTTPRIIIAGDPKQLGPVCASKVAERRGLSLSILERLMKLELYLPGNDGKYNEKFISMLKLNYRAHPLVLKVPNKLFYEGQLLAINKNAENDPIATLCVPKHFKIGKQEKKGFPVEFYSVIAKEQRNGKSPSYYNLAEMDVVIKYIDALMRQNEVKVQQKDIGIISPYIRQVHRIKHELTRSNYLEIEVGTTESYQGREKRILIITTVRGQSDLLLFDAKYDLGFVKNEKRMNVALTRAMSKLIIIGNPMVLNTNSEDCRNWRYLIEFCEENNSTFGMVYKKRDEEMRKKITQRIQTYREENQN